MLLFTLIFFLVAFSAALSPKVFLTLWYFHRSSYVCWLNTLKLTVVNEQVKIHWPIKSNFMLYTFSTVTPCYCIKGAHVRKESISFYLWLTYVQFAPLCFSWREQVQHTAGLVAPNGITGTQFLPFHSSVFNISKSFEHFRASQNLKWLVYVI